MSQGKITNLEARRRIKQLAEHAERGLLSLDDLYASVARLVQYDRIKHLEWLLPSAEVLPFPRRH